MTSEQLKDLIARAKELIAFPILNSHDLAEEKAELSNEFQKLLSPELVLKLLTKHEIFLKTLHQIAGMDTAPYSESNMDYVVQLAKGALK